MTDKNNFFHRVGNFINYVSDFRNRKIPVQTPIEGKRNVSVPAGRVSEPIDTNTGISLGKIGLEANMVKPDFSFEAIGMIRSLYKHNEDVGSIIMDLIQLTNTGHKITFDNSVDPDLVDTMRKHIDVRSKMWGSGVAGIHGIINKMIAQVWVGGALSAEMVPARGLKYIENIILVNPETIRFKRVDKNGRYHPYQMLKYFANFTKQYIKLNTNTYKYFGLISDVDTPYGVPPFMTALKALRTQKSMRDNIDHIMEQMGLLGYLETKVAKPEMNSGENDEQYEKRLKQLLNETKNNLLQGFKQGIVVGFEEDHHFDFHATTKNLAGLPDLFNQNENQIANGLKTSGTFIGINGSGTEQMLSIVFTKMLSQLKNVQLIITTFLEELYSLELTMAGYNFKSLKVEFKPSTITDDLKFQQATEIKQRIAHNLWVDGIIGQDKYADMMGQEKHDADIERPKPDGHDTDSVKKDKKEKDKDKSDRKSRDKKSNQPKRKDTKTQKR